MDTWNVIWTMYNVDDERKKKNINFVINIVEFEYSLYNRRSN